ncbi:hypothetical protein PMAYCL1PPCAC_31763, partial [Pristionchus mayeri]
ALVLLSLSLVCYAAPLEDLTRELLNEGLITLDDDGLPTTECIVSGKNGTATAQVCTMTPGFGPRSVGCFTVWNSAGIMQQGCYSNQDVSLRTQCQKRVCLADNRQKGVHLCCCHGPLCNA